MKEEIAELKIQIKNNTPLLDTIKSTIETAPQKILDFFTPDSVIKAQQMAQLEKKRENTNQICNKYNLHKKT